MTHFIVYYTLSMYVEASAKALRCGRVELGKLLLVRPQAITARGYTRGIGSLHGNAPYYTRLQMCTCSTVWPSWAGPYTHESCCFACRGLLCYGRLVGGCCCCCCRCCCYCPQPPGL